MLQLCYENICHEYISLEMLQTPMFYAYASLKEMKIRVGTTFLCVRKWIFRIIQNGFMLESVITSLIS